MARLTKEYRALQSSLPGMSHSPTSPLGYEMSVRLRSNGSGPLGLDWLTDTSPTDSILVRPYEGRIVVPHALGECTDIRQVREKNSYLECRNF